MMLAVGNPTVDFFSLDVEGAEVPILRTIPFDKVQEQRVEQWNILLNLLLNFPQVDIRMLLIEVKHVGRVFEGTLEELEGIMFSNG